MRKKLVIVGLVLALLTGAILFGSLAYVANTVLPNGSVEEFAALNGEQKILFFDEKNRYFGGSEGKAWDFVEALDDESALSAMLGSVSWSEKEHRILLCVTEPTQQLRDEIQQDPACRYMEVALAKCDYTLRELAEAEKKFEAFLSSAPKSLQDSVQFYMVMPFQNRVAVYVKNWSIADQLRLAQALGADCAKFYLVKGNLMETTENITIGDREAWAARDRQLRDLLNQTKQEESEEKSINPAAAAAERLKQYRITLYHTNLLIYPEEDWRMRILSAIYTFVPSEYKDSRDMQISASVIRSIQGTSNFLNGTLYLYDEWEQKHENMIRAVFAAEENEFGIYFIRGGHLGY